MLKSHRSLLLMSAASSVLLLATPTLAQQYVGPDGSSYLTYTLARAAWLLAGYPFPTNAQIMGIGEPAFVSVNAPPTDDNFNNDGATGASAIAIGPIASATGSQSLAVGSDAAASNSFAIALGYSARALGEAATALGSGSNASGLNAIAIGRDARAQGENSVFVGTGAGRNSAPSAIRSIGIGSSALENGGGNDVIAIGSEAAKGSLFTSGIAIGNQAGLNGQGANAISLGNKAGLNSLVRNLIALGTYAGQDGSGNSNIALGFNAGNGTNGNFNIAQGFGAGAYVDGINNVAIGLNAGTATRTTENVNSPNTATIGTISPLAVDNTVTLGTRARAYNHAGVAIGRDAFSQGAGAISIGAESVTNGTDTLAIGVRSNAQGNYSYALGVMSAATGPGSMALGYRATASAADSTALGVRSQATLASSLALGYEAKALHENSIALGNSAATAAPVSTASGTLLGTTYNYAGGTALGSLSIGNAAIKRTLTNLAAGRIADNSTDAINGSQLYATNQSLGIINQNLANLQAASGKTPFFGIRMPTGELPETQANYNGEGATGSYATAIGRGALADIRSTSIGDSASSRGGGLAIGYNAQAPFGGIALGRDSTAVGAQSVTLGIGSGLNAGSSTSNTGRIIIGSSSGNNTNSPLGVIIGSGAGNNATANNIIAVGQGSGNNSNGSSNIMIGQSSGSNTEGSINSFFGSRSGSATNGNGNVASGALSGSNVIGSYNSSVGIGSGRLVTGSNNVASGPLAGAHLTGSNNVALGNFAGTRVRGTFDANGNPILTDSTNLTVDDAVAIGHMALASANRGTALGAGSLVEGLSGVALGDTAVSTGANAIAVGTGAAANGNNSISIGTGNIVNGDNSGAIGDPSIIDAANSYSVGNNNTIAAGADNSFVLGNNVTLAGTVSEATALGHNSVVNAAGGVALGAGSVSDAAVATTGITLGYSSYTFAGAAPTSSVSIGSVGNERTLTNVAAGRLTSTSTDGVNGSQLFATNTVVDDHAMAIGVLQSNALQYDVPLGAFNAARGIAATNKIINLSAGTLSATSTDAVNGSQLFATNQNVNNLTNSVNAGWNISADGANGTPVSAASATGTDVDLSNTDGNLVVAKTAASNDVTFDLADDLNIGNSITVGGNVINTAGATFNTLNVAGGSLVVNSTGATYTGPITSGDSITNKSYVDSAIGDRVAYVGIRRTGASTTNYSGEGATGNNTIAIGPEAASGGNNSVSMGYRAVNSANNTVAIGNSTNASAANSVALGSEAAVTNVQSLALGYQSRAAAREAVSLGARAGVGSGSASNNLIAIGSESGNTVFGVNNVSMGYQSGSTVGGQNNLALGTRSGRNVAGSRNIALGWESGRAIAGSDNLSFGPQSGNGIVGNFNNASGYWSGVNVVGSHNVAHGTGAGSQISGSNNVAIGYEAGTVARATRGADGQPTFDPAQRLTVSNAIAMGYQALAGANDAIAFGRGSTAGGVQSLALGTGAQALGANAISIGTGNVVNGDNSGAIGDPSIIDAANAYSVGNNNTIGLGADNSFVLGNNVNIASGLSGVTALGNATQVNVADGVALGSGSISDAAVATTDVTLNGTTYTFAGVAPLSSVSIGAAGSERTLTNLAAGRISATSTDGINGSQLFATNQAIHDLTGTVENGWNISAGGANGTAVSAASPTGTDVDLSNTDGNLVVAKTAASNDVTFDLADNLNIGNSITIGGNVISTSGATLNTMSVGGGLLFVNSTGAYYAGPITDGLHITNKSYVDGAIGDAAAAVNLNFAGNTGGVVNRLNGETLTISGDATTAGTYSAGNIQTVTDPATGALSIQMAEAPKFGTVVVNDGGSGKITGVAAGTLAAGSTDAVNGGQLFATNQVINDLSAFTIHNVSITGIGASQGTNYFNTGATAEQAIAIGHNAAAAARQSIYMGTNAGVGADAGNEQTTAIGYAVGTGSTGFQNSFFGTRSGQNYEGNRTVGVGIGAGNNSKGDNSTFVGNAAGQFVDGGLNTAIGNHAGRNITGGYNVAVGSDAGSGDDGSPLSVTDTVSIGHIAKALSSGAIAMGRGAEALGQNAIAIGRGATTSANFSIALGQNSQALHRNSVALGNESVTATAVQTASATIDGVNHAYAGGAPMGTVSIGSGTGARTLTNLAAGRVNASSTDGVNGSQLFAVHQTLEATAADVDDLQDNALQYNAALDAYDANRGGAPTLITGVAAGNLSAASTDAVNGSQLFATNQNVTNLTDTVNAGWNISVDGANGTVVSAASPTGADVDLSNTDGNLVVAKTAASNDVTFDLADDLNIGNSITVGGNVINTAGATFDALNVAGGNLVVNSTGAYYSGPITDGNHLTNKDYVDNAVGDASAATNLNFTGNTGGVVNRTNGQTLSITGEATTAGTYSGGNLQTVTDPATGALSIQMADAPQFGTVIVNDGGTGVISGVTAGELSATSTEAVNGSQLFATNENVTNLTNSVNAGWNISAGGANGTAVSATSPTGADVDLSNTDGNLVVAKSDTSNDVTFDLADDLNIGNSITVGGNVINTAGATFNTLNVAGGSLVVNNTGAYYTGPITDGSHIVNKDYVDQTVAAVAGNVSLTFAGNEGAPVVRASGQTLAITGENATAGAYSGDNVRTVTDETTGAVQIQFAEAPRFGTVTINDEGTGRITGVTAGILSSTSTHAVNGSQLVAFGDSIASSLGGGSSYDPTTNMLTARIAIGDVVYNNVQDAIRAAMNQAGGGGGSSSWNLNTGAVGSGVANGSQSTTIANGGTATFTAGNNIVMTQNGSEVQVAVSRNLNDMESISIANGPTLNSNGIDMNQTRITNLADGIDPGDGVNMRQLNTGLADTLVKANTYTDEVFGRLNGQMGEYRRENFGGIASAMAMGALPQAFIPGANVVSMGVAGYGQEQAIAVGYSRATSDGRYILKAQGSYNSRDRGGASVGVGVQF